jgi:hypothetical protein
VVGWIASGVSYHLQNENGQNPIAQLSNCPIPRADCEVPKVQRLLTYVASVTEEVEEDLW